MMDTGEESNNFMLPVWRSSLKVCMVTKGVIRSKMIPAICFEYALRKCKGTLKISEEMKTIKRGSEQRFIEYVKAFLDDTLLHLIAQRIQMSTKYLKMFFLCASSIVSSAVILAQLFQASIPMNISISIFAFCIVVSPLFLGLFYVERMGYVYSTRNCFM